jgi:cyclopropane fatty-acyl-phospholipid synthase-like methyltransferase
MPIENDSMKYRQKFYLKYASFVTGRREGQTVSEVEQHGRPYDVWWRGWLPNSKSAVILDAACGSGQILRFFIKRDYKNVTGVDISPEQINLARNLCPAVFCADVLEFLRTHPDKYDLITALDVAEHLTKDEILEFFESCWNALRPGGRIIIQTPNGGSAARGNIWHGDFTHEHCFTANSLGSVLALSGFKNYEVRELPPVVHGLASLARAALWRVLRWEMIARDYIETGRPSSFVYTRVFVGTAVRP